MFITTEQTPNPNTLKFGVGKEVRGDATPLFFKKDTAGNPKAKAPVVEALFKIDDIESVLFAARKADTAFKMLLQVRNKVLEAYEEVKQLRI